MSRAGANHGQPLGDLVDLNTLELPDLYAALTSGGHARRLFELMRDEDLGLGGPSAPARDATSEACFGAGGSRGAVTGAGSGASGGGGGGRARLVAREDCRVAGLATIAEMAGVFGFAIDVHAVLADGREACAGDTLVEFEGDADGLLVLERSMLNLVSRLCGVATGTAHYVSVIEREAPGARARLYDTRKTTPGMRVLEKYAVRCGGGMCHRVGLWDAVLIKDNHLAGIDAASIGPFVRAASERARRAGPVRFVEVEVDTLEQLEALLELEPGVVDIVLLDNMGVDRLREAVEMRERAGAAILLEASGGVNLDTVGAIARTGVERVSVGALTHGARSVDLGLDI